MTETVPPAARPAASVPERERRVLLVGNRPGAAREIAAGVPGEGLRAAASADAALVLAQEPGLRLVVLLEPAWGAVLRGLGQGRAPAETLADWSAESRATAELLRRHRGALVAPRARARETLAGLGLAPQGVPSETDGTAAPAVLRLLAAHAAVRDPAAAALSARLALHLPPPGWPEPQVADLVAALAAEEQARQAGQAETRAAADRLGARLAAAEAERDEARVAAEAARDETARLHEVERGLAETRRAALEAQTRELGAALAAERTRAAERDAGLEDELAAERQRAAGLEAELAGLRAEIDRIFRSSSMRLTAPIRALRRLSGR